MNFGDAEFLALFLPLVWVIHWLLPRRASAQNAWLLFASVAFFCSWSPRLVGALIASTLVQYGLARFIRRETDERRKGALLTVGVLTSLLQLAVFKYLGFFALTLDAVSRAFGGHLALHAPRLIVPVGLSFWTLQQIAHLVDVHDERDPGDATALEYATWVAFFPRLVSGPIVRGREMLPQLREARTLDVDRFRHGVARFFRGFVGKYLVAATVGATLVNPVFAAPERYSRASHWLALAGYAMQVYADFAGYSEMALGCAALFGITLPENFNHPFFARNINDFWRRWHMSLTSWLFDYIYSPLVTGQGRMRGRLDLGIFVVFAISGLWHGATWAFVAWGALNGLGLAIHRRWDEFYRSLCRKNRVWVARRKHAAYQVAAWAITQGFFLVTLAPFRAATLPAARVFARGLLVARGFERVTLGGIRSAQALAVSVTLLVAYELANTRPLEGFATRWSAVPPPLRGAAYGVLAVWLGLFMPLTGDAFIYAQF